MAVLKRERSVSRNPLCYQCKDTQNLVTPMNGKTFLVRTGAGEICVSLHTRDRGQLGGRKQFSGPRSIAKTTLHGLLSPILFKRGTIGRFAGRERCARNLGRRIRDQAAENLGFRGIVQTGHSDVANLRMLEGCLTLPANKNPCGHVAPRPGDSQKAGEHLRIRTLTYQAVL